MSENATFNVVSMISFFCKLYFNVSNRSSNPIKGMITATLFDQDSDPIDHGKVQVNVGTVSGDKLSIEVDCSTAAKYTFRIE